ncbi:MAG: sensor histidine kinase [Candidatus Omnitrophica bacterium]|nr:sensor histidine kinase [Candidatus Omnitrophota bacterium]
MLCDQKKCSMVLRVISTILIHAFFLSEVAFAIPIDFNQRNSLSPWTATETQIKQKAIAELYRKSKFIWIAKSERYLNLLERYNAKALRLPSGRYLMARETEKDDLVLIRAVTHENYKLLMQREEDLHLARYKKVREEILNDEEKLKAYYYQLSDKQKNSINALVSRGKTLLEALLGNIAIAHGLKQKAKKSKEEQARSILFNEIIASAFELLTITTEKLINPGLAPGESVFRDMMKPVLEAKDIMGRYSNFSKIFFDRKQRARFVFNLQRTKKERFAGTMSKEYGEIGKVDQVFMSRMITIDEMHNLFYRYMEMEHEDGFMEAATFVTKMLLWQAGELEKMVSAIDDHEMHKLYNAEINTRIIKQGREWLSDFVKGGEDFLKRSSGYDSDTSYDQASRERFFFTQMDRFEWGLALFMLFLSTTVSEEIILREDVKVKLKKYYTLHWNNMFLCSGITYCYIAPPQLEDTFFDKDISLFDLVKEVERDEKGLEENDKNIFSKIEFQYSEELKDIPKLFSYPTGIYNIFSALIRDSCYALPQDENGFRKGVIRIGAKMIGQKQVKIIIEDNGPGMTEEELKKSYCIGYTNPEKRKQLRKKLKKGGVMKAAIFGGLGFGIPKAMKTVEYLKGELAIKSKEGKGTRIEITLPLDAVRPRNNGRDLIPDDMRQIDADSIRQAFNSLNKAARTSELNLPVSRLGGTYQRMRDTSKLHFCVPFTVFKNSADIALTLKKLNIPNLSIRQAKIPLELVVTGVTKEDIKLINGLNRDAIKQVLNFPGNLTVTMITEKEIQERARLLGKDGASPQIRAGIVKDLYLETLSVQELPDGEYMAIATDAVDENKAKILETQLRAELQDNISIRVLVKPDPENSMFSLSDIINDWLDSVQDGFGRSIRIILPILISPAEMIEQLDETIQNAWKVLAAV